MKTNGKRWRPSPPLVVVTTAMIVVASTILLGWLNARSYRVKARVEIADPAIDGYAAASSVPSNVSGLPDGDDRAISSLPTIPSQHKLAMMRMREMPGKVYDDK